MNPLHLVLIMLPIYFCLDLEIEDASNLHFRHIRDVAGMVGQAHKHMTVNITQHLELMKQLCTLPPNVRRVLELAREGKLRGLITTVDFKGVFDNIAHQAVWDSLHQMNCGPKLIAHIKTLYSGANSAVLN
jgi:hypothetical protein